MKFDYSELKGRIVAKFGTQSEFSRKLGINESYLSMKLTTRGFSPDEILKISELLDISKEEIGKYFFCQRS